MIALEDPERSSLLEHTPVLVLGLGNVIVEDDGAGVKAIHTLLRRYAPRPEVKFLDGGTLGLALLPLLEACDALVLVDAVRVDGCPPGTVVKMTGDDVAPAVAQRLSVHQVGVVDLLDGARLLGKHPETLVLCGIVPASLGLGVGCTPAVEAGIPKLVELVAAELALLGYPLTKRGEDDDVDADRVVFAARALGM